MTLFIFVNLLIFGIFGVILGFGLLITSDLGIDIVVATFVIILGINILVGAELYNHSHVLPGEVVHTK